MWSPSSRVPVPPSTGGDRMLPPPVRPGQGGWQEADSPRSPATYRRRRSRGSRTGSVVERSAPPEEQVRHAAGAGHGLQVEPVEQLLGGGPEPLAPADLDRRD